MPNVMNAKMQSNADCFFDDSQSFELTDNDDNLIIP